MDNSTKRSQQEIEDELPAKQQKVEEQQEDNKNEKEHPAHEKLLEPHQAFEIFAALSIAHQRKLLTLWRSIYEDHPIPDEWTRWKIYTWAGNKWNANDCIRGIDLSPDGMTIGCNNIHRDEMGTAIHAVHAAFPQIISNVPAVQICYYEAKLPGWFFTIDFTVGDDKANLHEGWNDQGPNPTKFGLMSNGLGFPGRWRSTDNLHSNVIVIGCGLLKHLGKQRIFFTKNGELLASVPMPPNAPNQLFPAVTVDNYSGMYTKMKVTETNFGLKPFMFKYEGDEEKLLNGLGHDFEQEA